MKKLHEIERLSPMRRRRFLQVLSAAMAAPMIPRALRYAANEIAGGKAYAATLDENTPRYLIEINLRDQWDHGHLMVAPGLATYPGLQRGTSGRLAALFFTPEELQLHEVNGTQVYLTAESVALQPHLDHIAMIDLCELSTGAIHGHESANPLRSPGRSYSQGSGKEAMWLGDPVDNFPQGCEAFYTSTPTPATVVNHAQRQLTPSLKPGIAFKGISRGIHTAYHFAASLGAASELRRHYSRDTLFAQFPATLADYNVLSTPEEADAMAAVLSHLDARTLDDRKYSIETQDSHGQVLSEVPGQLYLGEPKLIDLPLTEDEVAYWSAGVPPQSTTLPVRGEIWEQMAWATKLVTNDLTRAVALEFDYLDIHDTRTEAQMRTEAAQVALPLARMIEQVKAAGIWEQTTIAIYTTDGSRAPAAGSYGTEGKNTVILAGGCIRGGYYGDIQIAADLGAGHSYRYHPPDDAGAVGPGTEGNSGRISGARVWRTVMRSAGVADSLCDQFPDVAGVAPLPFVLR